MKRKKERKHFCKRLLSVILCAALLSGILPHPWQVQAAGTAYNASITVNTSNARGVRGASFSIDDNIDTIKSPSNYQTKEDCQTSMFFGTFDVTSSGNRITGGFTDPRVSIYTTGIYIPFSVPMTVPAHTTRTCTMKFSLGFSATKSTHNSRPGCFAELIQGDVPAEFYTGSDANATGNRKLRIYTKDLSASGNGEVKVEFDNATSSDVTKSQNFVFFWGTLNTDNSLGYRMDSQYTCELTGVTYEDTYHTADVTFDPNGGSVNKTSKTVTYKSAYGELPTPTRSGYRFDGWYTAASGGSKVESTTTVTNGEDHTLYAHWTIQNCTVTFHANGGGTPSMPSKTVTYGQDYGDLAAVSRTGYTFAGWYTAASGGSRVDRNTTVNTTENHTLYAHWTANSYTVTFDKNGGNTPSKADMSVTYDGTYGTLATVSRTGYAFAGWYTALSGGTQVTDTTKVETAADHTLYARWTANKYTITFSGAVDGSGSAEYTYAQGVTVPFPQAVQNAGGGYFTGWKLTASPDVMPTVDGKAVDTSSLWQPGQQLVIGNTVRGNMTFTAQYLTLDGTAAISETLAIGGMDSVPNPPAKSTYTVKVQGNEKLAALNIGGVTVTRTGTEDFVLTAAGSEEKAVSVDGETVGSVEANGTFTLCYKTLTVTANAEKAVTLEGGPALTRTGPVGGVYTYTHTACNPSGEAFHILVDGTDSGRTVSYGGKTELTWHTVTADIHVQQGASVRSVELVSGTKILSMDRSADKTADGSDSGYVYIYAYTDLENGTEYTLRVNGIDISGQTADFSTDQRLNATNYAKTATTKLDGEAANIPGVSDVAVGGIMCRHADTGIWVAEQAGTPIGNDVAINGKSVAADENIVIDYYTVRYDAGGGTNAPVDSNVYRKGEEAVALGEGEMENEGSFFTGWQKDGANVSVGESFSVNAQTTLTAQWQENAECEVEWHVPGGEMHYGMLVEALRAAAVTSDVTITVQDGKTALLPADNTLPEDAKLVVPVGTKVVSAEGGATLTVYGRIENAGSLDEPVGTLYIKESGTLANTGTVLWNILPNAGKIDNTGGTLEGDVRNTDDGILEGGTVTGTVTGGTVTGPLTDEGTIEDAVITGPVQLPEEGKIIDSIINGVINDEGGEITGSEKHDGNGAVNTPGGSGTGDTPAEKLIDALGGAAVEFPTGTIVLIADVNLTDEPLVIDDDIVIDLNGHTITGPDGNPAIVIEDGNVTVKDTSETDNGSVTGGSGGKGESGAPGIENKGSGTVTIEDGSVSGGSGGTDGDGGAGIENTGGGNVMVTGGEVRGGDGGNGETGSNGGSGIENKGSGTVTIQDGSVQGGNGNGDGTGGSGVTNTGGTVDITGGSITGGTGGITGAGDGGEGGKGIDSAPDQVAVAPDASVSAGAAGEGSDGMAVRRKVTPTIDAIPDQQYTGSEITPDVVLRDGVDIIPASEYTAEYSNNIHAGTATVVIKDRLGKENALYQLSDIGTTFEITGEPEATPVPGTPTPAPGESGKPTPTPGGGDKPTPTPGGGDKPTPTPGGGDKPTSMPGGSEKPSPTPDGGSKPTSTPGGKDNVTPAPLPSEQPGKISSKEKREIEIHSKLKAIQTGKKLQISWGRVTGADGYSVYVQYCSKSFSARSLNQVKSGKKTKITVKKVNGKKLDTTKNYKLYVVAWQWKNGKKSTLAKTLTVHVAGENSVKYTNVKGIQLKKASYTLKKGGAVTLHPKAILYDKRKKQLSAAHCKEFRYLSSNKKVATVTAGGKVKAKGSGECTIYVFAKNGCRRKIKIKVKK